jgi:hypothetical protein
VRSGNIRVLTSIGVADSSVGQRTIDTIREDTGLRYTSNNCNGEDGGSLHLGGIDCFVAPAEELLKTMSPSLLYSQCCASCLLNALA